MPLLLSACGLFSKPEPPAPPVVKHVHHEAPPPPAKIEEAIVYPPGAYPLHLTLAKLTLQANPGGLSTVAADLDIARAYSLQSPSGPASTPVVILEYALRGQQQHDHIVIPFSLPARSSDLPELEEAMLRFNALSYTLYDLKLGALTLPALPPLGDEGGDPSVAAQMVDNALQPLAKAAAPLPLAEQARVNLELARFFMQHQYQEAAYLAIENAKQSLAAAVTASQIDQDTSRDLSLEIDAQEGLLHKTMPFTLGF